MEPQRAPAEAVPGQKVITTVKQGPPPPVSPQNQQPPHPQQGGPQPGSGPPPGPPRFPPPPVNNGPADGPPRFQQPGGPPPLRHLDSRSQLNPGAPPQFPPPRPPYGPPQRGPPPRNPAFFGRPPQPGSPSGGPPPRFPPPGPQFQNRPPPPPQGYPPRPPFRPPLQRTDSQGGDPRFVRPNLPPDPRQQLVERRVQFRPQLSSDRMAEVQQQHQQPMMQRPPAPMQASPTDPSKPKSALNENMNEIKKEQQPPVEPQKNVQNTAPTVVQQKKPEEEVAESTSPSPQPPKTPGDNTSIVGFDDGKRRSLTSARSSPVPPPTPANSLETRPTTPKKKTTFADEQPDKLEERTMKKSPSERSLKPDAEHDSGVDESTQRREKPKTNGLAGTPRKTQGDKSSSAGSPVKSPSKYKSLPPRTPETAPSTAQEKKKVPMNKVQVGAAPSPNLKQVRSKIGSLNNATYKPGGGNVKIENRKLDFSKAQPRIAAKNDTYAPSGGDKKIQQVKLQWNAKPKIGSLENATYKPGGGDKKIESIKLDFKDKAKPKVGSKENAKHVPGGGSVKTSSTPPKTPQDNSNSIETHKIDLKAESKIGSLDNVKYKPGGGDKKIFDDKSYLRQTSSSNVGSVSGSGSQSPNPSKSGSIAGDKNGLVSDENLNQEC